MYKLKHWFFLFIALALVLASCAGPTQPPAAPIEATQPQAKATEKPAEPTAEPAEPTAEPTAVPAEPTAEPTVEPTAEPTAAPAEPQVTTFIFTQEFDTLNPLYTNMWFSAITQQLWNCWAWDFDDSNSPHPVLVAEMPSQDNGGISTDGKVITFKLRDDIVWSDGTPITSEDFAFTAQMAVDPANSVASTYPYDLIDNVATPDPQTVVVTFIDPYAAWMGTMWKGILPAHILKPAYDSAGNLNEAEWNRTPTVGCGPYNFAEWESGSYTRFVANENYWLAHPKIGEIFIRFVPDDASQIAALVAGDGDLGTFIAYPDIPALEDAGIAVIVAFSGYNEGLYFYLDPDKGHPALQDVRVRQAIAMATDRFSIVTDLLLDRTAPAVTDWDNTPYVDPALEPWPYDPDQANALLDEAGWIDTNGDGTRDKDGVELSLKYGTTTREIRKDTQAVIQEQLAEVGIQVELLNYDSDLFFSGYDQGGPAARGELDLFEYSSVPNFPDPDVAEWRCDQIPSDDSPSGTNWQAVCDETLDQLFQDQATQVDFATRQATFQQITQYIYENVYWLGLWQDPDLYAINNRLTGYKISGVTPFYNISEWEIAP